MSIGNIKSEGNKGHNFPYQSKVLQGLQQISDNTSGGGGSATEATLISLLAATVAGQDMEILLVRDIGNANQVVQQIREYDETTLTWSTSYQNVLGAVYVPVGPLVYLDPSAVLNLLLSELMLKADVTETQPISAASLPLPAGAATSILQTNLNSTITSLSANVATELTLGAVNTKLVSLVRVPKIIRTSGPAGTITPAVFDFSVANIGAAAGSILGGVNNILAGETLNFSAGAMNNYYAANSIAYNGTGTELLITYNS